MSTWQACVPAGGKSVQIQTKFVSHLTDWRFFNTFTVYQLRTHRSFTQKYSDSSLLNCINKYARKIPEHLSLLSPFSRLTQKWHCVGPKVSHNQAHSPRNPFEIEKSIRNSSNSSISFLKEGSRRATPIRFDFCL